MSNNSEKGIAHILLLLILLGGLALAVWLVLHSTFLKSKAARTGTRIEIVDSSGNEVGATSSQNVKVKVVYVTPTSSPSASVISSVSPKPSPSSLPSPVGIGTTGSLGINSSVKGVATNSDQLSSFPTKFRLANSETELAKAKEVTFTQNEQIIDWTLIDSNGLKTVFAQFYLNGIWGNIVSTTITFTPIVALPPAANLQVTATSPRTIYYPKVLAISLNPAEGKRNLASTYFSFSLNGKSPSKFEDAVFDKMIVDFKQLSNNGINYQIAKKINITQFPKYTNNFKFTINNYQNCASSPYTGLQTSDGSCETQKWLFDIQAWFKDNNICKQAESVGADEIWIISPPFIMSYESLMVGSNYGFDVNGSSYTISGCKKHYIIENPVYDTPDNFLHDYGHRVEATMNYITSVWNSTDKQKYWEDFANINRYGDPAMSANGCGNTHFPLNGSTGYDVGNATTKSFNCPDWKNFPHFQGTKVNINCNTWGCDDPGWQKYWLGSIPYSSGTATMISSTGKLFSFKKDWWYYLLYPENAISFVSNPYTAPVPIAKKVFVTSTKYNGNLGGLSGADAKCQSQANIAKLNGTFKAWLSDNTTSAITRLSHYNGPYQELNGTIIAVDWEDLVDGTLQNPISITEAGKDMYIGANYSVWTGSTALGSSTVTNCSNWTTNLIKDVPTNKGGLGTMASKNSYWSQDSVSETSCGAVEPLYCFEQ